ncbi:MAG: cytidine deaminase [Firmicutes bacterium]|nr:cytidine deaminase [Bacillota bacterium]
MREVELVDLALAAREKAYAPYSGVFVGAALLTREGKIFSGANVENASFALTVCAERAAVIKAVNDGCCEFVAIAVAWNKDGFCRPCGACRQVLYEFSPKLQVYMVNANGEYQKEELKALLPHAFEK